MKQNNHKTVAIEAVNTLAQEQFTELLGDIFEHSPDIAEQAWSSRPFASADELHQAMMAVVRARNTAQKKEFFAKHPELSAAAVRGGGLTAASVTEQSSAGLDALSHVEEEHLQSMNRQYRQRHGFPFIICVRHYTKEGIFFELQQRVERETEYEMAYALNQIQAITRNRLLQVVV